MMYICRCSCSCDTSKFIGQRVGNVERVFGINQICTDLDRFSPMEPIHRFLKYRVEREVLDEQRLEEVAQRKTYSDTHPPLTERLKDTLR